MTKLLYISASPYSGTTLLSFLLNTHPDIVTVAHTTGWHFDNDEKFYCSCGELIQNCPFYRYIKYNFEKYGLNFQYNNFGTNYTIVENERINRYLLSKMPFINDTHIEKLRDHLIYMIPIFKKKLINHDLANKIFINSAVEYSKADVFVDNSHNPYRLRQLKRINEFDIFNLHLIRDPRGVALSNKKHKGWDVKLTTKLWINKQNDIYRISNELPNNILIYYEDLCENVNKTLEIIYNYIGINIVPFDGKYKTKEHHIIGNDMRLKHDEVKVDKKWRSELSKNEINDINNILFKYKQNNPNNSLTEVITYFMR